MKFLCMICTERAYEELHPHEAARQLDEYVAFMNDIRESGHYVGCNRLLPVATEEGDVLLVPDAGAYGMAMANTYNLRALPGQVVIGS